MKVSQEVFQPSTPDELRRFVRDRKARFDWFRRVIVQPDSTRIVDINRNELVFPGISFGSAYLEMLLREAGAAYDPVTLHTPPTTPNGSRVHNCGACYPWGHDSVS